MVSHERIIYKLVSSPMFRNTPLVPRKVEPHQTGKGKVRHLPTFQFSSGNNPKPNPPHSPSPTHTNTQTHRNKQKNINYHWIGKVKTCD